MQIELDGVAPLAHLGVIRAEGPDAAQFLHNQLTQDFLNLAPTQARLAAFCSAKGRMQASFVGFKRGSEEIVLICSRDILASVLKRLSMFVLRSKVKLFDVSGDYGLFGLAGSAIESIAVNDCSIWSKTDIGTASLVNLYPADGVKRGVWLAPIGEAAPAGPAMSMTKWLWSEVRSGVAMVSAPIVEAFVPQMLNYESIGGVNFKKGCYPGQEVVARSQFRGTLKRRAYLAHSTSPLTAGGELFQSADGDQPCGMVAQGAQVPSGQSPGGFDAVVCLQVSAFEAGDLHLGAPDGPALSVAPAPYPLLADI